MDLEDFLESHGFLDNDNDMLENPVLGTKTVVIDDEVGIEDGYLWVGGKSCYWQVSIVFNSMFRFMFFWQWFMISWL